MDITKSKLSGSNGRASASAWMVSTSSGRFRLATSIESPMSTATTSAPSAAASLAWRPEPVPTSSTLLPAKNSGPCGRM